MRLQALAFSFLLGLVVSIGAITAMDGFNAIAKHRWQNNAAIADILVNKDKG